MKKLTHLGLSLLSLGLGQLSLSAEEAAPAAPAAGVSAGKVQLLKNGSMELDANADNWPDDWPRHKDATREVEQGNHFIRLKSPSPGATVLLFQSVPLPAGAKGLEMKWKQRASDLKPGAQAWFDARIMLEFRNAEDKKVAGAPGAPYLRKSTTGWVERSLSISVPEGATHFVFMPSLFQVETGTFDLDDFSIEVTNPSGN